MSLPPNPSFPESLGSAASIAPDGRRIEGIKQYYHQLCTNYRMVTQQLQTPDLPLGRRQALTLQQEKLQYALQDFTERVIKPIISANRPGQAGSLGMGGMAASIGTMATGMAPAVRFPSAGALNNMPSLGNMAGLVSGAPPSASPSVQSPVTRQLLTRQTVAPSTLSRAGVTPIMAQGSGMAEATAPKSTAVLSNVSSFLAPWKQSDGTLIDSAATGMSHGLEHSVMHGDRVGNGTIHDLAQLINPKIKLTKQAEQILLDATDHFVMEVAKGVCESARHRKRPGITLKDFELIIGQYMGQSTSVSAVPHAVPPAGPPKLPPKKSAPSNSHQIRMTQLRKFLAVQAGPGTAPSHPSSQS